MKPFSPLQEQGRERGAAWNAFRSSVGVSATGVTTSLDEAIADTGAEAFLDRGAEGGQSRLDYRTMKIIQIFQMNRIA